MQDHEATVTRIFERLDSISEQIGRLSGDMRVICARVDAYKQPCDTMLRHLKEQEEAREVWKEVKKSIFAWACLGVAGLICAGLAFAMSHGWVLGK